MSRPYRVRALNRGSLAELKALTKGEFDETGILYLVRSFQPRRPARVDSTTRCVLLGNL